MGAHAEPGPGSTLGTGVPAVMSPGGEQGVLSVPHGNERILLLDTSILADHLRGHDPARRWLIATVEKGSVHFAYSTITLAELMSGLSTEGSGRGAITALLDPMEPVPVDQNIATLAGDYMRRWRRSHGLAMPDALIAGSAKARAATLVTSDVGHYPMDDIDLLKPY